MYTAMTKAEVSERLTLQGKSIGEHSCKYEKELEDLTLLDVQRFCKEARVMEEVLWASGLEKYDQMKLANWIFNNKNLVEIRPITQDGEVLITVMYLTRD